VGVVWGWGIIRQQSGKAFLRGALEWSVQGWEHQLAGPRCHVCGAEGGQVLGQSEQRGGERY